ncbi:MAG TPA: carboxypeptidase-like regulatory domain-containing protein, partial [Pyrinomonadaceae bacterium]|nr:carboxypeptidase-like regulatory domain-containing protein [Pyrinomonadaceae bacterium]
MNEAGQPLAGVVVFVRDTSAGGISRSTITNAEGDFRLNGLGPGLYTISGFLPAYVMDPVDPNLPTSRFRVGDTVRLELIRGGVITGTVLNGIGEPLIGVRVRAMMVRGTQGETPLFYASGEQATDDRGVYRFYGLAPGTYVISAGGGSSQPFQISAYDSDVPTYASSATRDNALEVNVRPGEENNVDIRYRGEPGHAVSGTVKLTTNGGSTVTILLANTYVPVGTMFQGMGNRGFAFYGMGDGEYDIIAQEVTQVPGSQTPQLAISERKRVVVKGADVTGLEIVPRPLPSLSGRIVLEPSKAEACQG